MAATRDPGPPIVPVIAYPDGLRDALGRDRHTAAAVLDHPSPLDFASPAFLDYLGAVCATPGTMYSEPRPLVPRVAIGGMVVSSAKNLWTWAQAKIDGLVELAIDEPTLSVLLGRQLQLLHALHSRSHAAELPAQQDGVVLGEERWEQLAGPMNKARAHPEWSRLGDGFVPGEERNRTIDQLAGLLLSSTTETTTSSPSAYGQPIR
jgi:hypothetical protein